MKKKLPNFRTSTIKEFDIRHCHIIYSTKTNYIIVSGVIYGKFINKEIHDLHTSSERELAATQKIWTLYEILLAG